MNKSVSEMTAEEALDNACDYIEKLSYALESHHNNNYEYEVIKEAESFVALIHSRLSN